MTSIGTLTMFLFVAHAHIYRRYCPDMMSDEDRVSCSRWCLCYCRLWRDHWWWRTMPANVAWTTLSAYHLSTLGCRPISNDNS